MAKKKTNPDDTSVPPPQPARRRAPTKERTVKKTASAVGPQASASDVPSGNGKTEPTQAEIAEAAYFKHLNRGGTRGDEFQDWIEAERELKERHTR
jgi:Protein of unknown function (DUF2934)